MTITADAIVEGVAERISMPLAQALVTPAMVLRFADTVIRSRLVPLVESLSQDYFVTKTEIPLVGGQHDYAIPYRSIGRKLRELQLTDSSGAVSNLPQIALEDARAGAWGFYFKGDLVVVPFVDDTESSGRALVCWWYSPPSRLCLIADAALVTSITGATVTSAAVPATVSQASLVDFVQGRSASAIRGSDVAFSSTTTTTVVFAAAADIPTTLAAGDYIAAAQTSPVVNWLSDDCRPLLETACAKRVLEAVGDFEGAKVIGEDVAAEEKSLRLLLEPRIDGEPRVIINRSSLVRGGRTLGLGMGWR